MKYLLFMILLFKVVNCSADVFNPISLDRMVYYSDVIVYGVAASQAVKKNKFVFMDFDGKKKTTDAIITKFNVIKSYKGSVDNYVNICIPNTLGYEEFELNRKYIVFLLKSKKNYVPLSGMAGLIDIKGEEVEHFFYSEEPYFNDFSSLESKIISLVNKEGIHKESIKPYQRYEKIINNPCW